ncbi:hypothetical protein GQ44DRAFT_721216 [Phaeosphaeriaceae sp. PMI808]|nr:hypothetical protein GQ44DRAFT_721216 [Phaeosphaeriaceae sp. PMI808]
MSQATATPTPTTTYPFTYTTYSTSLPSTSFSRPTIVPSIFSFGPGLSCSANSMASARPSNFPIENPLGLRPACAISNAREINDHAFWDLYECCKGKNMVGHGSPNVCTVDCVAENGQTWQELGECLSKRVEVVICKPDFSEIGRNRTGESSARSSTPANQSRSSSGTGSATNSPTQTSQSRGAGSTVSVTHISGSKAAAVLFAVMAVGSFMGMVL